MKKYLYLIFCFLLGFLFLCSSCNSVHGDERQLIASGRHYCIYRNSNANSEGITKICYNIYDSNGKSVLFEETARPLNITETEDGIINIKIGMGTGISIHKYYSVEKNLFSREFSYVVATENETVAYISIPEGGSFKDRKLVVQNIFDKELFYKEFQLDFSAVDTPVLNAEFTENGKNLHIAYLKGKENIQTEDILVLK